MPAPEMPSSATQTAVIVPVPAAERVVAEHRRRLDVGASWGVPAHVTVLYPFVHPTEVDRALVARLSGAICSVGTFKCTFERSQWFGDDVLWLAPEPDAGFRALTDAVCAAFPDHPPYEGRFDEVVPHLTVGERSRGTLADLRDAERAVHNGLPFAASVDHVELIGGTDAPSSWRVIERFPLASPSGRGVVPTGFG